MLGEGSEKWWSYSAKDNGYKGPQHREDTFWRAENQQAGCMEQTQQLPDEPPLLEARQ